MNKYLAFICIVLLVSSCSTEDNTTVNYPNILVSNPNQELYNIGQNILIDIIITHDEVLDNITYYESCSCTDDNFDSLNLLEIKDLYENEWTYTKDISTENIPSDIMCDYNIEISAEDLNGNGSTTSIYFHVMTMTENL